MEKTNAFHEAIDNGLSAMGKEDLSIKEEQYEALKAVVVDQMDCLVVLPTGFGKSLIYQILPRVFASMTSRSSTIIVVSPLNALMRDQVSKMRKVMDVAVVNAQEDTESSFVSEVPSINLEEAVHRKPQIIFAHPEVLVSDKRSLSLLKSKELQESVSAIVIDESHLVIEW